MTAILNACAAAAAQVVGNFYWLSDMRLTYILINVDHDGAIDEARLNAVDRDGKDVLAREKPARPARGVHHAAGAAGLRQEGCAGRHQPAGGGDDWKTQATRIDLWRRIETFLGKQLGP